MATERCVLGVGDADALLSLYRTYDWWADREQAAVERALAGTDEAVGLRDSETGTLVAAVRVLTDYTYYAMAFDVLVHADRREAGLGRELLATVVAHPPLSNVNLTVAAREGLVPFYESCGFEDVGAVDHPDGVPEELRFLTYAREE